VDLDGTLVRTDMLHETLLLLAKSSPASLAALPGWLARGKAGFKHLIAARVAVDASGLPYRTDILTLIEQAPKLSINFESSVGGLYFIGPMSEMSFGPITRFVAGAGFTAKSLSRHLARRVPKRRSVQPLQQQASIPRLDDRVRQQRADPMDVKIDERLT